MFSNRPPEGYCHSSEIASHLQTAVDEDGSDDDVFYPNTNASHPDVGKVARGGTPPCLSKPFSAVTPSMWPQDSSFFTSMENHKDPNHQPEYRFDEFGYRVEEEDGPEQSSRKLLSQPLTEDPIHKLRWAAELNLSSCDGEGEVSWEAVPTALPRTDKLCSLVRQGVPHSFRPQVWMRLAGSLDKKRSAKVRYEELVSASSSDILSTNRQIEKDLLRTLPSNACFSHMNATGVPRLRRLLRAMAWFYPDIGYCQGMGMIAANLLLFLEEEDAFWLMCTIVEDLLPASYYSSTLMGVQADQRVLQSLVSSFLPSLASVISEHDIELSLITLHWFVTVFASVLHVKLLIRTWDLFFCEGSVVLFKLTLAMLKIKEAEVRTLDNSADIFNALSDIPRDLDDADCLIKMMESVSSGVSEVMVETQRRQQLTSIMHEHGTLINLHHPPQHLPKQHLNRRELSHSGSSWLLSGLLGDSSEEDVRTKNVRQTELMVDLREAVLQVARHFQSMEPSLCQVSLVPDYSLASHSRDLQHFMATAAARRRRAKALLDFERHDQDELGFRKNDIITIISERDEHCWVGELNGLRGWFPAKFVTVLDERSKQYSVAGDDSVTAHVTDLVRGTLCSAIKALLMHGMRRSPLLGGGVWHPWLFLEEAANREVAPDFPSVYSRLVLCRTFRLDQDAKVLQPEELLYRCIEAVNVSHNAVHAQMDVKLRSLICMGLNEQVLHLWLECVCSQSTVVEKWYQPWSFMRSPGWVQIKCELRVLAAFPFNLNPEWELPQPRRSADDVDGSRVSVLGTSARSGRAFRRSSSVNSLECTALGGTGKQPLREGVRDMLVKHHLFSWDL